MEYWSSNGAPLHCTGVSRGSAFLLRVSRVACRSLGHTTGHCSGKLLSVVRRELARRYCSRLGLGRVVCSYLLLLRDVEHVDSLVLLGGFRRVRLLRAMSVWRSRLSY